MGFCLSGDENVLKLTGRLYVSLTVLNTNEVYTLSG